MIESFKDNNSITDPDKTNDEIHEEVSLRPQSFKDFVGQNEIINNLKVYIKAAKKRSESLDHVLLFGPPGLGKTTLSRVIANEMKVAIKVTSGPILDKPGDLAGILTNFNDFDILDILINLSSGTETIPIFGSIVQKGKFSACAFLDVVNALNKVDLPTLGKPTIPHLKPIIIFD